VESFEQSLATVGRQMNEELDRLLPLADGPERRLQEAMRYATLDGGKRLRPFLVLHSANLFHCTEKGALQVAVAIEMVHCYSLVHDDLPAMDDDDLRRGRPTCHKAFDEATAILAGDALLTKAFEVLANIDTHSDPQVRCDLVAELAYASGDRGMVGGQMFDLMAGDLTLDVAAVTRMQNMKTGRLIAFSAEAGAILGKAAPQQRHALKAYAHDLGLAFQIADDLLDVEGDEQAVGKGVRKDAEAGKATFVSLLGIERARTQADMLWRQAVQHLDCFDERADPLRQAARFVVERKA
jgi:farnesyl diphosphate synthase